MKSLVTPLVRNTALFAASAALGLGAVYAANATTVSDPPHVESVIIAPTTGPTEAVELTTTTVEMGTPTTSIDLTTSPPSTDQPTATTPPNRRPLTQSVPPAIAPPPPASPPTSDEPDEPDEPDDSVADTVDEPGVD